MGIVANRVVLFVLLSVGLCLSGCVTEKGGFGRINDGHRPDTSRESGFSTLSELTDIFSRDLASQVQSKKIYLDRAKIRDVSTGDVANFSSYLQNELEASLSRTFDLQVVPDGADLLLGATFQRYGDHIKIFFKYHSPDFSVNKSIDYHIEQSRIPRDSLKENLHSKAKQLAANIIADDLEYKIYVKPFESSRYACVSPFSRMFSTLVKSQIVQIHRQVEIIDDCPVKGKLSHLNSAGKRGRGGADDHFADADSVLEGEYVINGDQVMVTLLLKSLDGHVINSAQIDIASSIIKIPLGDPASEKLADLADRKSERQERTVKRVKLSTGKGGDYPVYFEGEKIVFYGQVKEPLFLYIYDITSRGDVALLYPYGFGIGQKKVNPGRLVSIPDEEDGVDLYVEAPFGKDAVKVFASSIELPLPTLSAAVESKSYARGVRAIGKKRKRVQGRLASRTEINPSDLVDYYRGLAERFDIKIYEDSILLETRSR
ncbi:DUF4384 domain-containing protein [Desulfotalea psychrophila]|nr:DUF4384 domain-containing protein [Desulfotalea psychrophila]